MVSPRDTEHAVTFVDLQTSWKSTWPIRTASTTSRSYRKFGSLEPRTDDLSLGRRPLQAIGGFREWEKPGNCTKGMGEAWQALGMDGFRDVRRSRSFTGVQ